MFFIIYLKHFSPQILLLQRGSEPLMFLYNQDAFLFFYVEMPPPH
jgi:hypothetical protein